MHFVTLDPQPQLLLINIKCSGSVGIVTM